MFFHRKHTRYHCKPEKPDPISAKQLRELIGGQWGVKYRDMLLDIDAEEIAHVEMLAAAGMNPQHMIVNGMGAAPNDSVGYPWTARHIVSGGNLLADLRYMLKSMIARDTTHRNQWTAACEELMADGLEASPCPSSFPLEDKYRQHACSFLDCSEGVESSEGRWARGPAPDGKGEFQYVENPPAPGEAPRLGMVDPRVYGTPMRPTPPAASRP